MFWFVRWSLWWIEKCEWWTFVNSSQTPTHESKHAWPCQQISVVLYLTNLPNSVSKSGPRVLFLVPTCKCMGPYIMERDLNIILYPIVVLHKSADWHLTIDGMTSIQPLLQQTVSSRLRLEEEKNIYERSLVREVFIKRPLSIWASSKYLLTGTRCKIRFI